MNYKQWNNRMKLALVTYEDEGKYPGEGATEDARLIEFLTKKGLNVKYETWTDTEVNWQQYGAVILKSPWDYFDKINQFYNWLNKLDQEKVYVLNPTAVVRWNTDKRYLLAVEEAGFPIVPSQIVEQKSVFQPALLFERWATDTIIVKPVISGGAKNTFSLTPANLTTYENKINELLQEETFLVQPFMPEIQTEGEWSLIFFNGRFSHCVLKVPRPGDFRVQHYFGGAIIPSTPPASVLEAAQKLVAKFASGCLYARVDGLNHKGEFRLMELELIEPMLYLQDKAELFENYYQALRQML
jgi:glutathione synthase/RimK-type ligase-like ATP-grasp enzyme